MVAKINRTAHQLVVRSLENSDAVILVGARQVGKSTLAKAIAQERPNNKRTVYYNLEKHQDLKKLATNTAEVLDSHRGELMIIDEVHRIPDIFSQIMVQIDTYREADDYNGHFLLLGSAVDSLLQQKQNLTGRATTVKLHGLNLHEVGGYANLERLFEHGGFPLSYTMPSLTKAKRWLSEHASFLVSQNFQEFGIRSNPLHLLAILEAISHNPGRIIKSDIASYLETPHNAVQTCLAHLEKLMLITKLPAYHANFVKRMQKVPKYYLCDSGLAQYFCNFPDNLHRTKTTAQLRGLHWEGFVIENVLAVLPKLWKPFYYRSHDGRMEIDLLLEKLGGGHWAIEIKTKFDHVSRSFMLACEKLQPERVVIVHNENRARYEIKKGPHVIEVLPLHELMTELTNNDTWLDDEQTSLGL